MEPIDNIQNESNKNLILFEFFSGIGGMHESLTQIPSIKIINAYPYDINPNANLTYEYNFNIPPNHISIESFTLKDYENIIEINNSQSDSNKNYIIWTMSPPCQPFTRQGNKKGLEDQRSNAFIHLINNIFSKTKYLPDYFFLENVKNFEVSDANKLLISILKEKKYNFIQFLFSPIQFNIPNSRLRFYLAARKKNEFIVEYNNKDDIIMDKVDILFKNKVLPLQNIKEFLGLNNIENDNKINNIYYLNKKVLEKDSCLSMDIVILDNKSTNCFTKNYSRLFKGTGSILLLNDKIYEKDVDMVKLEGYIRFFTPNEILKFHCFGENFEFPESLSLKAKYKLLGNSINVKVVNILLEYLLNK